MNSTPGDSGARQFAMVMMLITSFGASIGGMGTPVGTPPNLIGVGMLQKYAGVHVTFFQWMLIGVPVLVLMFGLIGLQFYFAGARHVRVDAGSTQIVRDELDKLGRVSRGQRNVLTAFGITVLLWVTPGLFAVAGMDDDGLGRTTLGVLSALRCSVSRIFLSGRSLVGRSRLDVRIL